jgi:hypothetical protein
MRALYDARIGDLGPADQIKITCLGCIHKGQVSGETLRLILRKRPVFTRVLDTRKHFRCRECKAKGRVEIMIDWAR